MPSRKGFFSSHRNSLMPRLLYVCVAGRGDLQGSARSRKERGRVKLLIYRFRPHFAKPCTQAVGLPLVPASLGSQLCLIQGVARQRTLRAPKTSHFNRFAGDRHEHFCYSTGAICWFQQSKRLIERRLSRLLAGVRFLKPPGRIASASPCKEQKFYARQRRAFPCTGKSRALMECFFSRR
jgi:hypothetical protein